MKTSRDTPLKFMERCARNAKASGILREAFVRQFRPDIQEAAGRVYDRVRIRTRPYACPALGTRPDACTGM